MRVSIIVPVYNVVNYLDECIRSILDQSFTDFELILVDDGSTDGSCELCDQWGVKDKRVVVVHQGNRGVSSARNEGIKQANGTYISFVDSDDWVGKDYLLHLVSGLEDADLAVSGLMRVFSDQTKKVALVESSLNYELTEKQRNEFYLMLKEDCFYGPVCKLYRREIIINKNILFPENCSYGEDLLFNFRYLEYVKRISNVPAIDYYYRILDSGSLTKRVRINRFENDYDQWKIIESFCKTRNLNSAEVDNYLGLKLWGIVYDSIFDKNNQSLFLLKKMLSIEEKSYLRGTFGVFPAKQWIKKGILHQHYFLFFVLKKLRLI